MAYEMNKPSKREGFVSNAQPLDDEVVTGPVIDNTPPPEPEPDPEPEPFKETWPVKVKLLHKPVRNMKGEMVRELVFREPTGGDINRNGNPCMVDQNGGDVIIIDRKMTTMMAALSGILQPFLENMDPRDWRFLCLQVAGVFYSRSGASLVITLKTHVSRSHRLAR